MDKAFMSWSGGKDSALSLYTAQQEGVPVKTLVTTTNRATDRVSMHGVHRSLVQQQAAALQLPLQVIELPEMPGMQEYEEAMEKAHHHLKKEGYTHGVFGDIFLEDLKQYRENLLLKAGLRCFFPLWKIDSTAVVQQFIEKGFKAVVIAVNSAFLDKSFCGRLLDTTFLSDLPSGVDPSGENGEYHSFVFDGPSFYAPIAYKTGSIYCHEYPAPQSGDDCFAKPQPASEFYFCNILPV